MEFASYQIQYEIAKQHKLTGDLKYFDWMSQMGTNPKVPAGMNRHIMVEQLWVAQRRPYYSVYPSVAEPLSRVTLELSGSFVRLPVSPLLFRFSVDHPFHDRVRTVLAYEAEGQLRLYTDTGNTRDGFLDYFCVALSFSEEETIEQTISNISFETEEENRLAHECMQIVIGCILLADDPDIITPDVLNKDQAKFQQNPDQKFIDRAVRRGKRGWLIGANMPDETSPHYRRPHFGLRWTGPGKKIPKIVPVKGTVVHRKKLSEMPTGRLDDEIEEASP